MLIATDPTTGDREIDPTITWHPDGKVGDARNDTTSQIHDHYIDGQHLIDRGVQNANVEATTVPDEWIQIN